MNFHGNLEGKLVVITGATHGIGRAALDKIVSWKPRKIIFGSRNPVHGDNIRTELVKNSPRPIIIESWPLDLSSLESVKSFGQNFIKTGEGIDLLLLNAGCSFPKLTKTQDGFEQMYQVNVISHFLLVRLLTPLLRKDSRVVFTSSNSHRYAKLDFSNLNSEQSFSTLFAYANSKLITNLMAAEFNRRLRSVDVKVFAADPGFIKSNIGINDGIPLPLSILRSAVIFWGGSPEIGANRILIPAVSENVDIDKWYYQKGRAAAPSRESLDGELARKVWDRLDEAVKKYI
ncbi:uncharacterized protein VTP21DRAFT_414 [Calcarisporiella thermophila]|uniref:uncharacterized protein n=1 Tax=Calcarisporiella thermophila TaxID=911321 RepID=UPI00374453A0